MLVTVSIEIDCLGAKVGDGRPVLFTHFQPSSNTALSHETFFVYMNGDKCLFFLLNNNVLLPFCDIHYIQSVSEEPDMFSLPSKILCKILQVRD